MGVYHLKGQVKGIGIGALFSSTGMDGMDGIGLHSRGWRHKDQGLR